MSNKEEQKSMLADISKLKKDITMLKLKASSGDAINLNDYRKKKKEIAKIFTKINDKKTSKK